MNRDPEQLWSDRFYDAADPRVLSAGFHKAEPGWVSAGKGAKQTDFDVWYVAAGGGAVRVDGRWVPFRAGDLIAIKPGSVYQRERADAADPFQIYFAHLLPFGPDAGELDAALARCWPLKLAVRRRPDVLKVFDQLFETHTLRGAAPSLAVRGLALQLLDIVFDVLRSPPAPAPPRAYVQLLAAKELIEAEYAGELSLAEIAAHCRLSASHLSALFTKHLGCAPIEYLLKVRLREAKLLLARGTPVKEAAYTCGFRSQHYFSRLFRKKTGASPTEFAAQHGRRD